MIVGRFNDRAQKALFFAQEEARNFKQGYIGTEHILMGIIREKGFASSIIEKEGVKLEIIKEMLKSMPEAETNMSMEIPLTPRSKHIIESSFVEARKLGHNYVSPEHILIGVIIENEGVAINILKGFNINLEDIKNKLINHLQGQVSSTNNQGKREEKSKTTPNLDKYGRDLTASAKEGKIDPIIGRDSETQRILEILCRRIKNNPCLIGDPGVGKTAVVEGLAQRIVEGNIPETLKNKRVVSLDISAMLAGSKYRGEFEERLKNVMDELRDDKSVIVFIDEIHNIIGAGGSDGAIDAANILKPALARGEIQCLGATTIEEYRKYIEKDSALERRFQPVKVGEPTKEESVSILKGIRDKYEAHHRVKITDEAIMSAVNLSDRYITDRFLPDKAIDLLDEAASKVRLAHLIAPTDLKSIESKLDAVTKEKEDAIRLQDFEKAASLRDEEKELRDKLMSSKNNWKKENISKTHIVDEDAIASVLSRWVGIPAEKITEKESDRLLNLENILHERVIGQEEAVVSISKAIRRSRAGLKDPKRPIGSFIFLGPTGVGKTELTKALAEAMFGDENNMVRVDMSEYMEKHSVSRLIGSPPGYVGYEEGGQLTEKVRRKPYSVILFDEIEKAHPDVFNVLLQILEDGRLTDGKGKTVDFRNTIIIMTSNIGAHNIKKNKAIGFSAIGSEKAENVEEYEQMKSSIMSELKDSFRPEFINRLDDMIVFHSLDKKDIDEIVKLMLNDVSKRLKEQDIFITYDETVPVYLSDIGYDKTYGARHLRRSVTKIIEDSLSEEILKGGVKRGENIVAKIVDSKIVFDCVNEEKKEEENI